MEAKLFTFTITDFEEVYTIIDRDTQRLHISSVNYNFNITLNLKSDLKMQIEQSTQWEELGFAKRVRKVIDKILIELNIK